MSRPFFCAGWRHMAEPVQKVDLTFPTDGEPERLDVFVAASVADLTRAAAQRLIETGNVTVQGKCEKPSLKLKGGEEVVVSIPPAAPAEPLPEEINLDIRYEDHDVIVVNKPPGMVVHPAAGNYTGTLVNALLGHCTDLSGVGGELRPGIVHRIDKETSGLLVAAKNDRAHQGLSALFKDHNIKRIYIALVYGAPIENKGKIQGTIGRHPVDRKRMSGKARNGKHAVTHWQVIARYPGITCLKLRLETGRTHQIRVHLSEAGFPLLGDTTYGGAGRVNNITDTQLRKLVKDLGDRQALHAKMLGFVHPVSGEYLEFDSELPEDMERIIRYLETKS